MTLVRIYEDAMEVFPHSTLMTSTLGTVVVVVW